MNLSHVVSLGNEIGNKKYDEIDMVIHSPGGDINAAYQMLELLRFHAVKINACVPFYAKSAATLLCIGADLIILDELAQLGPLDTQMAEVKGGKREYVSALNQFIALEQLQKFALETLDQSMVLILERSKLDMETCFKHAVTFVQALTSPLIS